MLIEVLDSPLVVDSPLGQSVALCSICRNTILRLEELQYYADLIVVNMVGFDILIGMDWMSQYHVMIDCTKKRNP